MTARLPDLSRFELQCLRRLWSLGEGSVRDVHESLNGAPSYSTVRKIVERLEEKGAVARVRLEGRAWVYRPAVTAAAMVRKEIRRFLDSMFDGSAAPLVAHLADMEALTLDDLREIERQLDGAGGGTGGPAIRQKRAASAGLAGSSSKKKEERKEDEGGEGGAALPARRPRGRAR